MRIDELARRADTTTRNIRAFQSIGVLPPPHLAGRTGFYDDGHLARLQVVTSLQDRGFSLASIRELLLAWEEGRSLQQVLGLPPRRPARKRAVGDDVGDDLDPDLALVASVGDWPVRHPAARLALVPAPLVETWSADAAHAAEA